MTQDEVINLFAPHNDSVNAVQSWLESEGIKQDRVSRSSNLQWIQFHATVTELEKLVNATYDIYENQKTGIRYVGTDQYSIPAELLHHIDFITPAITRLHVSGNVKARNTSKNVKARNIRQESQDPPDVIHAFPLGGQNVTSDCNDFITPRCLANMYNIPLGNLAIEGNELGIYEQEPYDQTDLGWFFEKFAT